MLQFDQSSVIGFVSLDIDEMLALKVAGLSKVDESEW